MTETASKTNLLTRMHVIAIVEAITTLKHAGACWEGMLALAILLKRLISAGGMPGGVRIGVLEDDENHQHVFLQIEDQRLTPTVSLPVRRLSDSFRQELGSFLRTKLRAPDENYIPSNAALAAAYCQFVGIMPLLIDLSDPEDVANVEGMFPPMLVHGVIESWRRLQPTSGTTSPSD